MGRGSWLALALFAVACTDGGDSNGGNDSDTGSAPGLPDPRDEIDNDPDGCEELHLDDGTTCVDIEGAERFFAADLTFADDGTVDGRFFIVLYANAAWQVNDDWLECEASEEEVCTVAIAITGIAEETGLCGNCERHVIYDVTGIDGSMTDCPDGYVNSINTNISGAYWGFDIEGGEAVGWDSGEDPWAPHGEANDKGVIVWSDGTCEWYGTGECS